jgi:MOSC domain-containing protein YiiM
MEEIKVGTLIKDMGKVGVITRVIQSGSLNVEHPIIKWRVNYEIYYDDGSFSIMGAETLKRLIRNGDIEII